MNYAYSVVSFSLPGPRFKTPESFFDLGTGVFLGKNSLVFQDGDESFWEKELGERVWDDIVRANNLVLCNEASQASPELPSHESKMLQFRSYCAFRTLPLVGEIRGPSDPVYLLTGEGRIQNGVVTAQSLKTFTPLDPWFSAHYQTNDWRGYVLRHEDQLDRGNFLESWRRVFGACNDLLFSKIPVAQINEAFRSFEEAKKNLQLDFKIPNLVRAMESIFACFGEREFIDRFIYLLAPRPELFSCSNETDLRRLLRNLIHLRNDCVHGRPFGYTFEHTYGRSIDDPDVAALEFVAEWGARRTVLGAMASEQMIDCSKSFEALKAGWDSKSIKPFTEYISDVC